MERPHISVENEIVAAQQRAYKEITIGIENEIAALHKLSAWKRFGEVAFFVCLYAIGALLVFWNQHILISLFGILCMGMALNSCGILIHEGLHGILAKREKFNHLFTFLVGLPTMISATAYQVTHTNHHYELGRKLDYGTYKQHTKKPSRVWIAYFLQLFFGLPIYIALIPFLSFKHGSRRARFFIVLEYAVIIAVYASFFILASRHTILWYWFFPVLVAAVFSNLRGISSHALGNVENIYLSSRTITSSKIVSLLFMHENYHLEHHIFPRVPSYNLLKLHNLIWDRLPEAVYSKSYLSFLATFFKAAFKNDLNPAGVVFPKDNKAVSESI